VTRNNDGNTINIKIQNKLKQLQEYFLFSLFPLKRINMEVTTPHYDEEELEQIFKKNHI
jgi:hypothetical protein